MVTLIAPSGDTGGAGGGAPAKRHARDNSASWEEAAAAAEAAERQRELEEGAAEALAGGLFRAFDVLPPPNGGRSLRLNCCLCVHVSVCSTFGMSTSFVLAVAEHHHGKARHDVLLKATAPSGRILHPLDAFLPMAICSRAREPVHMLAHAQYPAMGTP